MKTRYYPLLIFSILLPLAAVAASSGLVFAQSCPLQVGSISASQYSGSSYYYGQSSSNIQMTMPISLSCPFMGQLWAVGNVHDQVTNTNVGSNNIQLNSNGANYYYGQLVISLPYSVVEHQLQVSVSVYNNNNNGQYGALVAQSSPTVTIHASSLYNNYNNQYNYPNYNNYPYYGSYPYYYNGYPSYYYYSSGYSYYYYPYYYYSYSYPSYHQSTSCFNGQTIVYYNGAYYYASCSSYHHHHP
ncbi:MAG TPA: hypothetical protein VLV31_01090 [Candidatus Acidoferrales bacterium]|nr:hypothetical protein [Candidatus Acidoferrales bacterium]